MKRTLLAAAALLATTVAFAAAAKGRPRFSVRLDSA